MSKDMVEQITDLIKLDWDAAECYDRAIEHIETPDVYQNISRFADDHRRHVDRLSEYMESIGETPPKKSKDMKGYFLEGFAALRSMTGEDGALKALHSSEKMTNKAYREAVENENLGEESMRLVMENYDDEKKHIAYREEVLHAKV